jgi:hypothetical protein
MVWQSTRPAKEDKKITAERVEQAESFPDWTAI